MNLLFNDASNKAYFKIMIIAPWFYIFMTILVMKYDSSKFL